MITHYTVFNYQNTVFTTKLYARDPDDVRFQKLTILILSVFKKIKFYQEEISKFIEFFEYLKFKETYLKNAHHWHLKSVF